MVHEQVTWRTFRDRLLTYAGLDRQRRDALLFRGQGSSTWKLETTLDRAFDFSDAADRVRTNRTLLEEFRRESLEVAPYPDIEDDQLELLARHHGLPSPLMDWTTSPYVATYFAFAEMPTTASSVSVWLLDRSASALNSVDIIDRPSLLRFNVRAFRQRGLFLQTKVDTRKTPLETLSDLSLFRYDIPAADRKTALTDLDEMRVNAATLFADLSGVATTTLFRIQR